MALAVAFAASACLPACLPACCDPACALTCTAATHLVCVHVCAEEHAIPEMERIAEGGASRTLERIRVKRVNAGKLTMQNVLQGWTSMKDWNGDLVLQPFDLFNGELDDADATGVSVTASREIEQWGAQVIARRRSPSYTVKPHYKIGFILQYYTTM